MPSNSNTQNLYIRKLNGLGEKISVDNTLKIKQLKQIIRSLKSISQSQIKVKDFNLIFKGKNITERSQNSLKELNIPSDGIIHLLFIQEQEKIQNIKEVNPINSNNQVDQNQPKSNKIIHINVTRPSNLTIRIIFNQNQYHFIVNPLSTILDLKITIAAKLNLVYESIVLSHLGTEMMNDKLIKDYYLANNTLISLKFNIQRLQKRKLETRMVNSVTFSDENNQPNKIPSSSMNLNELKEQFLISSSKSIDEEKQEQTRKSNLSNFATKNMYKSQISAFGSSGTSKAALMFKNALHQKIAQTQSIVSGSFSQDMCGMGLDPNMLMITVRNQEQTREYVFECSKTHQIKDIKDKLLKIERVDNCNSLEISLEEDLFQSIDLNNSGCVTLNEIVKKMGKQRTVFIYRQVK